MSPLTSIVGHLWMAPAGFAAAFVATYAAHAWRWRKSRWLRKRFSIPDEKGFAEEISGALLDEREDGSSLLTDLLDKAGQKALEDGALCFVDARDK